MSKQIVEGDGFEHVVYREIPESGEAWLHVYLEGDGTPWRTRFQPAADPTPRNPLALRLMALDERASVYVGRPCYHGFSSDPGCGPAMWTSKRYSEPVLHSLAVVIERIAEQGAFEDIVLIGYSGGGALAALLAPRLERTRALVTVAANLDTEAWTGEHAYSPLDGSLNPAASKALDASVVQLHYVGSEDAVVPPRVIRGYTDRQPGADLVVMQGFDHRCCWEAHWPEILERLDANLARSPAAH